MARPAGGMNQQLPPVVGRPATVPAAAPSLPSPTGLRRPLAAPEDSPGHPFDEPYGILQGLKMEMNEIRAAVQAERQERAFEVKKIGQDVAEIHRLIAQGQADLAATGQTWTSSLRTEVARIDTAAREMQDRLMQGTVHAKKALGAQIEVLQAGQEKARENLYDVQEKQEKAFQEVARKIDANAKGESEFAMDIRKDVKDHSERLKLLYTELGEYSSNVTRSSMWTDEMMDAVQKMKDRIETNDKFVRSHLSEELQRIDKVVEEHRVATASAIQRHWKTTTADVTEVRARLEGLKSSLEGERRERVQTAELLGGRVDATLKECSRWTVVADRSKSLYTHQGPSPRY